MVELDGLLTPESIVVSDASYASIWTSNCLTARAAGQRFLSPRGLAGIGWGLPLAIGAQFAMPEAQVVCVSGDGGFAHVWGELEMLARHRLPITLIILNSVTQGPRHDGRQRRPKAGAFGVSSEARPGHDRLPGPTSEWPAPTLWYVPTGGGASLHALRTTAGPARQASKPAASERRCQRETDGTDEGQFCETFSGSSLKGVFLKKGTDWSYRSYPAPSSPAQENPWQSVAQFRPWESPLLIHFPIFKPARAYSRPNAMLDMAKPAPPLATPHSRSTGRRSLLSCRRRVRNAP